MEHFIPVVVVTLLSLVGMMIVQARFKARLARLFMAGWAAHYFGIWANLAVTLLVYGSGDALNYHRQGRGLANAAYVDPTVMIPELLRVMLQLDSLIATSIEGTGATATMVAGTALLCLGLGNSLYAVSIAIGMAAYFGKVFLFLAVRERFPPHLHWQLLVAILLVPSAVFWAGGIVKEAVILAAGGLAAWGASEFVRRRSIPFGLLFCVGIAVVALVKAYVLLTAVAAFGAYLYWEGSVRRGVVEIKPVRLILGGAVALGGVLAVGMVVPRMSIGALTAEMSQLQEIGNRGGSGYAIGPGTDAGLAAQLLYSPLGLATSLFRPMIFEARNPQMLVSAVETTAGLILCFRAVRIHGFAGIRDIFVQRPFLMFCLVFVALTGVGVGLASANLGTLSRYRAPLIPFYAILLLVLNVASARARSPARSPARHPAARRASERAPLDAS